MRLTHDKLSPLSLYIAVVSAAGLLTLVGVVLLDPAATVLHAPTAFWVFAGLVIMGELLPIKVPRLTGHDEVNVSTTFAFALLLTAGAAPAILAQGVASAVADAVGRKPLSRSVFNVAQYTLSLAASAGVLALMTDVPRSTEPHFTPDDLPAILVAACVFFVANNALPGAAQALAQSLSVLPYLREDFGFQASTAAMLLGLAPIVVVAEEFSLYLLPLLALPLLAVYKGGRQAALNEHQALHDSLTDLPNRALFNDRAEQALALADRDGTGVAVLLMDLDRFKEINDTLGHDHGDALIQAVGPRLRDSLRASDTVARLGGDEFAILLPGIADIEAAQDVGRSIVAALEKPFNVRGLAVDVGASIGIACFPDHGRDVGTLMQRADVAMYLAKARHTGVELYAAEEDKYSADRLGLVSELRAALEGNPGLLLHYQPKLSLDDRRVHGAEALLRWEHPERGSLRPDEFIPLAENAGLVRPLTLWVLDAALGQCRAWRDAGLELDVAVNLSVRNLLDRELPDDVGRLLKKWGIASRQLELEVTESEIMADPVRAVSILDRLSAMGVRIAIDDFGTGYSSLAYLKRLPVNAVKIDRSFVMNMAIDRDDAAIVKSTIELGHSLGMEVVAEGVESEDALCQLAELGCDAVQGYHLSRPLPAEGLVRWLSRRGDEQPGSAAQAILAAPVELAERLR